MLFKKSTLLAVVGIVTTSLNPTYAAAFRRTLAESSESRDDIAASVVDNEIYSLIKPDSIVDFASFVESTPTHDSKHGSCVYAKDFAELSAIIGNASDGDTILLCPGKVTFNDEIVLTKSITIECAGTKGSCVFDGNEKNRHFFSDTSGVTLVFISLVFINGFADDASSEASQFSGAEGGSVFFLGAGSTSIFTDSLFYNNLATSSKLPGGAVSIIYECTHVKGLLYCQYLLLQYSLVSLFFYFISRVVVQLLYSMVKL